MTEPPRVLDLLPAATLDDHLARGGGRAVELARAADPDAVLAAIEDSGLRGRGGGGFPTGRKWRTVAELASAIPATVVVNGAEGEPGTFKDRAILRRNPYRVLEGALVAATVVGADRVVVALKRSFKRETERVRAAIAEVEAAGWAAGVALDVALGPEEYLFGEETALLEVLNGRPPFPRVAPPFRHGADEVGVGGASAAGVQMAAPTDATLAPPTLVNNVETLANVPGVVTEGPDWFRELGTPRSPGTITCTVTGATRRHAVGEVPMGTTVGEVLERLGDGPQPGHRIIGVLSGVAHPLLPEALLDTPATYEDLEAAGAGLGAAGFIVFDDTAHPVSIAQGVARFLAVESCGQCTPCKQDGLEMVAALERLRTGNGDTAVVARLGELVDHVTEGARCYLAHQQQRVVGSVLRLLGDEVPPDGQAALGGDPHESVLVAPIVNLERGRAELDRRHAAKQPDWSHDQEWSGSLPAELVESRAP